MGEPNFEINKKKLDRYFILIMTDTNWFIENEIYMNRFIFIWKKTKKIGKKYLIN